MNRKKIEVPAADPAAAEQLIKSILAEAGSEAEKIISQAEEAAAKRRKSMAGQVETIEKKAKTQVEQRLADENVHAESAIKVQLRRMELNLRQKAIDAIIRKVRELMAKRMADPGYDEVLKSWIIEAALGLDAGSMTVNASKTEYDRAGVLLGDAEKQIAAIDGRKVELVLEKGDPLIGQGIVVRSKDGRMAFDNRVLTRIKRYREQIHSRIMNRLFEKENQ